MCRLLAAIFAALMLMAAERSTAANAPDPSRLLLYHLLDLDQRDLFAPGEHNALAEMQAWSALYNTLREQAKADVSDDHRRLKAFMLMGWIARAKNDFAIAESFNNDFMALFEARPDDTLKVMAAEDFLLSTMCAYLGKYFFFEDHDPAGRGPWVERFQPRMRAILGAARTRQCVDSFWGVRR